MIRKIIIFTIFIFISNNLHSQDKILQHVNLSMEYFERKQYDKSVENINIAIDLSKNEKTIYECQKLKLTLFAVMRNAYDFDKQLKIVLNYKKDDYDVFVTIADFYMDLHRYKEALNFYNLAIKVNPDIKTIESRGWCYSRLGNFGKMCEDYKNSNLEKYEEYCK